MRWPGRSSGSITRRPAISARGRSPRPSWSTRENGTRGGLSRRHGQAESLRGRGEDRGGSQEPPRRRCGDARRRIRGQEPGCAPGPLQGTRGLRPGAPRIRPRRGRLARARQEHPASDLDAFYDRLNGWTPGRTDGESLDAVRAREHEAAYRKYVEAHRAAKGVDAVTLVGKARERLALWGAAPTSPTCSSIPSPTGPAASRPPRSPTSRRNTRNASIRSTRSWRSPGTTRPPGSWRPRGSILRTLCGDLLKPEDLDDDVQVIVDAQAEPELCPRKTLIINWKDQKRNALSDSGFDEFTIDPNKIESLVLAGGNTFEVGPNAKPLKGTDYSDAVHAFNDERAKVKQWSEAGAGRAPPGLRAPRVRSVPRPQELERADPDRPDRCPR